MTETALTLYVDQQFSSPWAMSAFVALSEKALPFTLTTVDLAAGQARQPAFAGLAATERVPALLHGAFALTESSAIVEYLEETFGAPRYRPLLPAEPKPRALARQMQAWLRSDLQALRNERTTMTIFFTPVDSALSPAARADADKLIRVADRLIQGEHLFGQWCIADTELAVTLNRLLCNGHPVPPKLRDYAHAQWERASVRLWLAQPRA
ncbi:MAG: glutathione transferase [Pseudomonadota bacterium]